MTKSFLSFFENYENHHSFLDLINLCKEINNYIYNNDIINSQFFSSFTSTKEGYEIKFDENGKNDYIIDLNNKTIKNQFGYDQIIDDVYENLENLYDNIKNIEVSINIKQIDEKIIIDPFGEENWENDNDIKGFMDIIKMNESFKDELKDKISDKYLSLKHGILELLDNTLDGDIIRLEDFIIDYIEAWKNDLSEPEEIMDGFIEDAEIFDFYLKYQADIDQILSDNDYYDEKPGVESLYDYVIHGTRDAVVYCMDDIKNEIFGETEE